MFCSVNHIQHRLGKLCLPPSHLLSCSMTKCTLLSSCNFLHKSSCDSSALNFAYSSHSMCGFNTNTDISFCMDVKLLFMISVLLSRLGTAQFISMISNCSFKQVLSRNSCEFSCYLSSLASTLCQTRSPFRVWCCIIRLHTFVWDGTGRHKANQKATSLVQWHT